MICTYYHIYTHHIHPLKNSYFFVILIFVLYLSVYKTYYIFQNHMRRGIMKKLLAILLCLFMAFSMIGCAGKNTSVNDDDEPKKEKKKHNVEEVVEIDDSNSAGSTAPNDGTIDENGKDIFDTHYNSRIYGEHILIENDDFVLKTTDGIYAHKEYYGRVKITIPVQLDLKDGFDKSLRVTSDIIYLNDLALGCEMQTVNWDIDPTQERSKTTTIEVYDDSEKIYYDLFGDSDIVKAQIHFIISADNADYWYYDECNTIYADDYTENTPFADNMKQIYSSSDRIYYYSGIRSVYQKEDVKILFAGTLKDIDSEYTGAAIEHEYRIYADGTEVKLNRFSILRRINKNTTSVYTIAISKDEFDQMKSAQEIKLVITEISYKYVRDIFSDYKELELPVCDLIEIDITEDVKNYQYNLDE